MLLNCAYNKYKQWIIIILIFFLMAVFLFVRAFYGMDITDETFYLAIAKRFHDGDMLVKNDWNTGQLFGLLMLPFYEIYTLIYGSNEGIILCSRIVFVVLELFSAAFLLRTLVRYTENFTVSTLSSLCILVYARGNIITFSYYSLGFLTFLLAVLWWIEAEYQQDKKIYYIFSGISFAVSVVCMPYMIILFAVLLGTGVYWHIKKLIWKSRRVLWWTAGIMCAGIIFLAYFWKIIPWKEIFQYLPMVFQDPVMEEAGLVEQFLDIFKYIVFVFMKYTWPVYMVTLCLVFFPGMGFIQNLLFYKILTIILIVEFIVQSVYVRTYFESGIILVFFLFAFQMQLLYPKHRLRLMEKYFLVPGFLFCIPWILGSNVGERVINMGILLMDLWSILFLWTVFEKKQKKICMFLRASVFWMFAVLFVIRMFDVYRDGSVSRLTYKISCGVMKGINTEENRGKSYEQMVGLLRSRTDENNTIVVVGTSPWVYMDTNAACGACTVWKFDGEEPIHRQYYEKFPEKIPDTIMIVSEEINIYTSWKYSSHGSGLHNEEQPGLTGILKEITEEKKYICLERDGAKLYKCFLEQ